MTDGEIDQGLQDICLTEDPSGTGRYRHLFDDRQSLMICAQAIVETLRQIRDRLPTPTCGYDPEKCTCLDWPTCTCNR